MARSLSMAVICLLLTQILLLQQSMADESTTPEPSPSPVKPSHATAKPRVSVSTVTEPPPSISSRSESSEIGEDQSTAAEAPEIRRLGKHKSDKSVAGGGVIIGGLVTAIFAAVFCYIRVTRKRGGVY